MFRYLLLIGIAWLGAALGLLADVLSGDPAGRLEGLPRLLAVVGLAVIVGSLALMVTIRTVGWPRSFIPPSVRGRATAADLLRELEADPAFVARGVAGVNRIGRGDVTALVAGVAALVGPVVAASIVVVVLGRDDPGAIVVLSSIQAVFSAGSVAVAAIRRWLRRGAMSSRWADLLLLGIGTAVGAVPALGFALTAGGLVAAGILLVAGGAHGWAAVVLDRWVRGAAPSP